MGGVGIDATVVTTEPTKSCLATCSAISTSVRKVYSKNEKKLLKECNKVGKKVKDLKELFRKSIGDVVLTGEKFKDFLSVVEMIER